MGDMAILAGSGRLSSGLSCWHACIMPAGTGAKRGNVSLSPRRRALAALGKLRANDPRAVCDLLEVAGKFPGLLGMAVGEVELWLAGRGRAYGSPALREELSRLSGMYREAAEERRNPPERVKYSPPRLDDGMIRRLEEVMHRHAELVRAAWIGERLCRTMPRWRQLDIIVEARKDVWIAGNDRLRQVLERIAGEIRAVFDEDCSLLIAIAPHGVRPRMLASMRRRGRALLDPVRSARPARDEDGRWRNVRRRMETWRAGHSSRRNMWKRGELWRAENPFVRLWRSAGRKTKTEGGTAETAHGRQKRSRLVARGIDLLKRGMRAMSGVRESLRGRSPARGIVMGSVMFSTVMPPLLAWQLFVDNSDTHARLAQLESMRLERLERSPWRREDAAFRASPEGVVRAYLAALAAHDVSASLPIFTRATGDMLKRRHLTRVGMEHEAARYSDCGNPDVFRKAGLAIVRFSGADGTGACAPFLLRREGGGWRLDLTLEPGMREAVVRTLPLLRGSLRDGRLAGADARADRLDMQG